MSGHLSSRGWRTTAAVFATLITLATLVSCADTDTAGAIKVIGTANACTPEKTEFTSGKLTFTFRNDAPEVSELYVLTTDLDVKGEVENVPTGQERTLNVDLPSGDYELNCKPGMTGDGFSTKFTVTGGTAGSATDTTIPADSPEIDVKLTATGCDPTSFTATAGAVKFDVTNTTTDRAEFEVVSDPPGFLDEQFVEPSATKAIGMALVAGKYKVFCTNGTLPAASLVVSGDATVTGNYDPAAMATAIADYKAYALSEAQELSTQNKRFTDAVRAGDLATAKSLYAPVRVHWERIEPIAELFPDSDAVIDSRVDDFPGGVTDPTFTGYHRLEYGLFEVGSTDGLKPFADQLDADLATLITSLQSLDIQPQVMVNGPGGLIEETSQSEITGEEERYSHTDLVTFWANVEGSRKIVDLIEPMVRKNDSALVDKIYGAFDSISSTVDKYRSNDPGGFVGYQQLTDADKDTLKSVLAQLAEDLSKLGGALGVEVKE